MTSVHNVIVFCDWLIKLYQWAPGGLDLQALWARVGESMNCLRESNFNFGVASDESTTREEQIGEHSENWLVVDVKSHKLDAMWTCTEEVKVAPFQRSANITCWTFVLDWVLLFHQPLTWLDGS